MEIILLLLSIVGAAFFFYIFSELKVFIFGSPTKHFFPSEYALFDNGEIALIDSASSHVVGYKIVVEGSERHWWPYFIVSTKIFAQRVLYTGTYIEMKSKSAQLKLKE